MNASVPWHDPVVTEIHAIREQLAKQVRGDLVACSKAAEAACRALGLRTADERREIVPLGNNPTE